MEKINKDYGINLEKKASVLTMGCYGHSVEGGGNHSDVIRP